MNRKIKFSAYARYEEEWIYAEKAYELYDLFGGYSDGQLEWLRQYTGMEEIDGREVYEGDIIQNRHGGHFLVKYEGQLARWVGSCDGGWVALDDLLGASGQIVGNKFENLELTEKVNTREEEFTMNIKDFYASDSITFEQKFSDLRLELERIESDLWSYLDDQEQYLSDDDLEKEKEDVHYLEGKREGFEEALAAFYNVENVEKVYEKKEDN